MTDDVSIVEAMGLPVFITKGEYTNLKVRLAGGQHDILARLHDRVARFPVKLHGGGVW